jgi:hypothetical protein
VIRRTSYTFNLYTFNFHWLRPRHTPSIVDAFRDMAAKSAIGGVICSRITRLAGLGGTT